MEFNWERATAERLVREAVRLGADQRLLVRARCACARVVLPFAYECGVCTRAVETAERWTVGEATAEELSNAAQAAWAAHVAGVEAAAPPYASGAAYTAYTASYVTHVKSCAVTAASSATYTLAEYAEAEAEHASGKDESLVHNAARTVLTREVFTTLSLRHAVLGDRPTPRDVAQWDEAVAHHELHATLSAWREVFWSNQEGAPAMAKRIAEGARQLVCETIVVMGALE